MGLVTQVFDERRLAPLDGHLAIGHVRYSTTGSSSWRNAQPVYRSVGDAGFALGHNGNLTNTAELAEQLGMLPGHAARRAPARLHHRLRARRRARRRRVPDASPAPTAATSSTPSKRCCRVSKGGFSFVMMDDAHLIGVRDPTASGRSCSAGSTSGWVLASETCRARHRRRALRARGRAGRDGRDRRVGRARASPLRRARPQALPLRVRLLRAARHDRSTATACTRRASAWARSSRARRRSTPTW